MPAVHFVLMDALNMVQGGCVLCALLEQSLFLRGYLSLQAADLLIRDTGFWVGRHKADVF